MNREHEHDESVGQMHLSTDGPEDFTEETISQVSEHSTVAKKIGMGLVCALVLVMLSVHFLGHKKTDADSVDATIQPDYQASPSMPNVMASTPTVNNATGNDKLQAVRSRVETSSNSNGVAGPDEKFYRLQQNAPISMYEAKAPTNDGTGTVSMPAGTSSAVQYNGQAAGGNLPLSSNQVNKLRSLIGSDTNSQFQQTVSTTPVETVNATQIAHADFTVPQGTLISGSLETAINSDLPGMVSAVVSSDVYAMTGDRVLIPKGSKLIGQYNSGLNMGQKRVMIVWSRVIRADGIDVMLGSPGADALGQSGLGADRLDTHFWDRFGEASLLSIIGGGIANAGVTGSDNNNSSSQYRMMLSNNFQQVSGSALASTMNIKPTIQVDQGEVINVFVNRDLSFYGALGGGA